jgi:2-methylcitrate dehydratase PrpD
MPDALDMTGRIGGFLSDLRRIPPPPEVMAAARQSLIDWCAAGFAARTDPEAALVAASVHGWRSQGAALGFDGQSGAAAPIALINGTFAHALDYDDFHVASVHHVGAPTFAAVMALGMERGASGARVLRAFIAGFEVAVRLGMSGRGLRLAQAGWHPTSVLGAISAAVALADLLDMEGPALDGLLGHAAAQVGGLMAAAGTIAKPLLVGRAAMSAVIAADLAERGASVPPGLLEGEKGIFTTLFQDADERPELGALGQSWEVLANTYKPYSSCQLTHAPIDAALAIRDGLAPEAIDSITLRVNPFALTIAGIEAPASPLQCRFSLRQCVAMVLAGSGAGPADFNGDVVDRPDILGLRNRISVETSEEIARTAATIELRTAAGELRSARIEAALGSPDRPMSPQATEAKFRDALQDWPEDRVADFLQVLREVDSRPDALAEISRLVAR